MNVDLTNVKFGLEVEEGVVTKAPLIFDWMRGKKISSLREWFATNNATVSKVIGAEKHSFDVNRVKNKDY